jgi:hypothetical protein
MTSNPFFPYMLDRVGETIDARTPDARAPD